MPAWMPVPPATAIDNGTSASTVPRPSRSRAGSTRSRPSCRSERAASTSLVGQTVCAVVYDSDISINYDRSTFPYTSANLQGETLGIVAFDGQRRCGRSTGFSSSTLPEVQLTITETSACGNLVLFNAPVPKSSSVPNDIDPGKLSFDYRNPPSFRTRVNEELIY